MATALDGMPSAEMRPPKQRDRCTAGMADSFASSRRIDLIQHPVRRDFRQHDAVGNTQQGVARFRRPDDPCGSTVNKVLGVRGVALMSAVDGKWESRARSAASLSVFESGLYGDTGSVSGGLGAQ